VVDFAIAFVLLVAMMAYYGVMPGVGFLLVPAIFGLITVAALGIGTLLSALNVAYRDFRYVIPFLVQLGMFATPTVYMQPDGRVSGSLQAILALNPMTPLIAAFRAATLGGPIPWGALGLASTLVVAVFVAGCLYFRKVEGSFADII
jgi:homopolymeric O-antigen transport system permease protein